MVATSTVKSRPAPGKSTPVQRATMRPAPAASGQQAGGPAVRLDAVIAEPGGGAPLAGPVREAIESRSGADLGSVRVYQDQRSAGAVDAAGARAVTFGSSIFLGPRESHSDLGLMAHEAAHVIQQEGPPAVQAKAEGFAPDAFEVEADAAATAVVSGEPFSVTERTGGPSIQRQEQAEPWWRRGAKWVGDVAGGAIEFGESIGWKLLDEFAPELVPIIKQGPLEWLKERISAAVDSVFDTLMAPVRVFSDLAGSLGGHFAKLIAWMTDAAGKIARGDCGPIAEAAETIRQVVEGFAAPIVERIKGVANRVREFFTGLWERFGAPVWEFLKRIGGQAWEKIQQFGRWIWEKTEPIRRTLSRAWTWIKNKLGIGEGPEGQDGILQWVQRKATAVWEQHIKPFVEKHKKPLLVAAGVLALLSPAGPVIAIGGAVAGLMAGVRWIRERLAKPGGAVEDRGLLEGTILPAIVGAADRVSAFLTEKANSLTERLGAVVGGLGEAVSAAAGSVFRFATSAFQWLVNRFRELVEWAREKLFGLVGWVRTGLTRLRAFARPLLDFLKEVGGVVSNILNLPALVLGKLWKLIPACIRDPFVDFFVNQILKRIPVLKDMIELLPAIWSKLKATALAVIRKVFKEGDLKGAALEIFRLVLDALKIPLELVTGIFTKAIAAKDMILANPLGFLGNLLGAVKQGFIQFGEKIFSHLKQSVVDWLRAVIESAGLRPPADFSLKSVFAFALEVLGISLEKILERIEKKIGKDATDKIRKTISTISKVWDWISTLLNEGPEGVWNRLKERLGDLWKIVLDSAIGWAIGKVVKIATPRITAALATAPIGAIVEAIIFLYKVIQSIIQYARRVLEIVHSVMEATVDIARGAIANAANLVERNLGRAITVAIGFLANYLGLGDLGKKLKEIVEAIQEKVTAAIDWLIDKVKAGITKLVGAVKAGVAKLQDWWKRRKQFTVDGEEHAVLFRGQDRSAKLRVASDEMDLDAFLSRHATRKSVANDVKRIRALQKEIEGLLTKRNPPKPDEADPNVDPDINQKFDEIAALLPALFKDDAWGTEANPVLMTEYPKKALSLYRPVFLGPRVSGTLRQDTLASKQSGTIPGKVQSGWDPHANEISPNQVNDWISQGGTIHRFEPFDQKPWPWTPPGADSPTLGIAPEFRIQTGSVFKYQPGEGTPGGRKINKALGYFGYRSTTEGTQGDHVLETQLIGVSRADKIPNLWPLLRNQNQHGLKLKDAAVENAGDPNLKISKLDEAWTQKKKKPAKPELWVMVKTTRDISS